MGGCLECKQTHLLEKKPSSDFNTMATPKRSSFHEGELDRIFRSLTEQEEASDEVSFSLEEDWIRDRKERVMSADGDTLRKMCLELIEEAGHNKEMVTTLIYESRETKKKIRELEENLKKQEVVLCKVVTRLDENKKLESSVKRSEERVDKIELDKKSLETNVKKVEESMTLKYNEVVKMKKGLEEDKNELSKMNSKVNEVVTNVKGVVKGVVKEEMRENAPIIKEESDRSKAVIISGLPEPNIESGVKRGDHLRKTTKEVFDVIKDDEDRWMEDVIEIRRLGKYNHNKGAINQRPVKVRFNTERTAMEVLAVARKLRRDDKMKGVYIDRDMSIPERTKHRELRMKAREANEARSEEEAKNHFFAVRWGKVMKLTKRDVSEEEVGAVGGEEAPKTQQ